MGGWRRNILPVEPARHIWFAPELLEENGGHVLERRTTKTRSRDCLTQPSRERNDVERSCKTIHLSIPSLLFLLFFLPFWLLETSEASY